MSDPRVQAAQVTAQFIGATGTVLSAVVAAAATAIGPFSAHRYVEDGTKKISEAEMEIYKKEDERGDFIIPQQDRTKFMDMTITPLAEKGQRLNKATKTAVGSLRNWNEARQFYQEANFSRLDAEELSANSLRKFRAKEEERMRQEERARANSQQNGRDTVRQDEHCREREGGHEGSPQPRDQRGSYQSRPAVQPGSHQGPPARIRTGRSHSTASSQQSYSTARTDTLQTTQQYASGTIYQSPTSMDGPSFANHQGYSDNSNQV